MFTKEDGKRLDAEEEHAKQVLENLYQWRFNRGRLTKVMIIFGLSAIGLGVLLAHTTLGAALVLIGGAALLVAIVVAPGRALDVKVRQAYNDRESARWAAHEHWRTSSNQMWGYPKKET